MYILPSKRENCWENNENWFILFECLGSKPCITRSFLTVVPLILDPSSTLQTLKLFHNSSYAHQIEYIVFFVTLSSLFHLLFSFYLFHLSFLRPFSPHVYLIRVCLVIIFYMMQLLKISPQHRATKRRLPQCFSQFLRRNKEWRDSLTRHQSKKNFMLEAKLLHRKDIWLFMSFFIQ